MAPLSRTSLRAVLPLVALVACGRDDDDPPPQPAPPTEPSESSGDGDDELGPVSELLTADTLIEPPTLDEPEIPTLVEPTAIDPGAYLLAPTAEVGQRFEWRIRFADESQVSVVSDGRTLLANPLKSIEATVAVTVAEVDKGHATRMALSSVAVTGSHGSPAGPAPAALPATGDVWDCVVTESGGRCRANDDSSVFPAPRWLPLGLDVLLPGDAVVPAHTWSRRTGVAALLGMPDRSAARAHFVAEAPYETFAGRHITVSMNFDGTTTVGALGTDLAMRIVGNGGFEFDLRSGQVVAFEYTWTAATEGRMNTGSRSVGHARRRTATLRLDVREHQPVIAPAAPAAAQPQ